MRPVQPQLRAHGNQGADISNLFQGYLENDSQQTAKFVGIVQPMLYAYFRRHCRTISEAEDMTQECWARIHVGRFRFQPGKPVVPWLFGVARHTRLDAYRKSRIRSGLETALAEFGEFADPHRMNLDDQIEVRTILSHLNQLTESQRRVLVLYYLNDLPQEEISRELGCTTAAVKQKAFRARIALRDSINPSREQRAGSTH